MKGTTDGIVKFKTAEEMERWLATNHSNSEGIWIRFFKKDSGVQSIRISEALEIALCYGWITGQARPYDEKSWLGWFTLRRPCSLWSKINTGIAERLIKEGRMKPAGIKQIEDAKRDGRWYRAYSPQRTAKIPRNFIIELNKNKKAKTFFKTLNRANTYAIIFRLENTKNKEGRKEKIKSIVGMLAKGKTFH